jgi:hypothetical protein
MVAHKAHDLDEASDGESGQLALLELKQRGLNGRFGELDHLGILLPRPIYINI